MNGEIIHVIATHLEDATYGLEKLSDDLPHPAMSRADDVNGYTEPE